jgi:Tfp pilus assembly protein PilF
MANLASVYKARQRIPEAESLLRQALLVHEKFLGPDHPEVATTVNNLGHLLWLQKRFVEAEPYFRRALGISEKTLGPQHPSTAQYLSNLEAALSAQGKHDEAEPPLHRALAIRRVIQGQNDGHVPTVLDGRAGSLAGTRREPAAPLASDQVEQTRDENR